MHTVNLAEKFAQFSDYYSPKATLEKALMPGFAVQQVDDVAQ